jgi:hypothetical protein
VEKATADFSRLANAGKRFRPRKGEIGAAASRFKISLKDLMANLGSDGSGHATH